MKGHVIYIKLYDEAEIAFEPERQFIILTYMNYFITHRKYNIESFHFKF